MNCREREMIAAADELDDCLDILKVVYLSMSSPAWCVECDNRVVADVIASAVSRIAAVHERINEMRR